jgi:hypothetical protein
MDARVPTMEAHSVAAGVGDIEPLMRSGRLTSGKPSRAVRWYGAIADLRRPAGRRVPVDVKSPEQVRATMRQR